jgi:DNA-binding CsgD family transcriptional regulator
MNLSNQDYERILKLNLALSTSFSQATSRIQEQLSNLFGFHSSILWKVDRKGHLSDPIPHRISDSLVEDYKDYFHKEDYLYPLQKLDLYRERVALRMEDVTSMKNYESSTYYKEFMKKHGYYHEMRVTLLSRNKVVGVLGLSRPASERGLTEEDCHKMRILAPILANLIDLENEHEELRGEKEILEAFATKSETGFILLDEQYNPIYVNPRTWDIYREVASHNSLDQFIEEIITSFSRRLMGATGLPLQIHGYKVQVIAHQELFLSQNSRFAIIIEREEMRGSTGESILKQLTQREREVFYLLKKGYKYKEISEELFISINTVNKHVKNIYRKTGVNNRASLHALL